MSGTISIYVERLEMTNASREQNESIRNRCYVVSKFSSSALVAPRDARDLVSKI